MQWHLLHTPPMSGPANMAVDEALLIRARATGEGVLRLYTWSHPTISLGRNQVARDAWNLPELERRGVQIVRRLTGGRAILHHREFTYSVTAPTVEGAGLRDDYRAITRVLDAALRHIGVISMPADPKGRMPIPASAPCFELPARDELVVDGRKLVASAQVREDGAYLQHGSVLLHDDQPLLAALSRAPLHLSPAATLSEIMGTVVSEDTFLLALEHAMVEVWHTRPLPMQVDACTDQLPPLLARYQDPAWTWRR